MPSRSQTPEQLGPVNRGGRFPRFRPWRERGGRYGGPVPKQPVASASSSGGPGSTRARLRLVAVLLLGVLTALYLVFAVRLYVVPAVDPVVTGLIGVAFAVVAVVYGVLTRAVAKQSRVGHVIAIVVAALGALLSISVGMEWLDWVVLLVNLGAFGVLLGCVPRRRAG